jgi:hypothetical protein
MSFPKRKEDGDDGKCNERERRPASSIHDVLSFRTMSEG